MFGVVQKPPLVSSCIIFVGVLLTRGALRFIKISQTQDLRL